MCLDVVYRGKQKREALAKLPEEFVVWKGLTRVGSKYTTSVSGGTVFSGEMKAPYLGPAYCSPGDVGYDDYKLVDTEAYRAGWHAYLKRRRGYCVGCAAKKKHIRAIGEQNGRLVVVLSHITFPKKCGKPPKKK